MATETGENKYAKYGQPTLDLVFTGDKKSLNDRVGNVAVEFTRTQDTQSTYVKSDGTIGYASTDVPRFDHDPTTGESLGLLVEESRDQLVRDSIPKGNGGGGGWSQRANTKIGFYQDVSPDGNFTATSVIPNSGSTDYSYVTNNLSSPTASECVASTYAKPINGLSSFVLKTGVGSGAIIYNFNFGTGAITLLFNTVTPAFTPVPFMETLSNGWFRCGFTSAAGTDDITLNARESWSGSQPAGDGVTGMLFWGAQVEEGTFKTSVIHNPPTFTSRASEATFYNENGIVSTASTDVARDNAYLPDENGNFISAELLLEDTATNNIIYSGLSTTSNWATDFLGTTTEVSGLTGPFDTATLFEVTGTGPEAGRIYYSGAPDGGDFQVGDTVSVFVKLDTDPTGTSTIMFRSGTQGSQAKFTIATETTTVEGSNWENLSFQKLSGGWYRFSADWIDASASSSPRIWISDTTSVVVTSPGTKMYVKGFQSENSSYPTSYIPTTSSISTRAADISSSGISTRGSDQALLTGTDVTSWYNISEGTVYSEAMSPIDLTTSRIVWHFRDPGRKEHNADNGFQWYDVGTGYSTNGFTYVAGVSNKQSYAYSHITGSSTRACLNGAFRYDLPVNPGATPSAHTTLSLGSNVGTNLFLNGYIKQFTYWPTRLSDSDIQRLTE